MWKKLLFLIELLFMITAYTASFWLHTNYSLSVYGIVMMCYFVSQIICSIYNEEYFRTRKGIIFEEYKNNDICKEEIYSGVLRNVVLLVVGHRENPDYWSKCLESINELDNQSLLEIVVVIDGNSSKEDDDMFRTANTILNKKIPASIFIVEKRGKRGVLYFGIEKIRQRYGYNENDVLIVLTDSDSILEKDCILRLQECILSSPSNGCATGFLKVFNTSGNLLPKLINARYAYAFGIERSAQSYFGCMTCCSGPLSIYRLSVLDENLMQRFCNQKLCGVPCEPGDDRHLTNLVMQKGFKSRQTSLSKAGTEAPETLIRFLLQQLRWSRSYYREFRWQLDCISVQSPYLGIITVYESVFPVFVFVYVIYLFFIDKRRESFIKALVVSLGILLIRTLIMAFRMRSYQLFYNILFYPMYFIYLLPTKLFALVSVNLNGWVTADRSGKYKQMCYLPKCSADVFVFLLFILTWKLIILYGIYNIFIVNYI